MPPSSNTPCSATGSEEQFEHWSRSRGYAHFDIRPRREHAEAVATDPSAVAKYAFWPLIGVTVNQVRWAAVTPGSKTRRAARKPRPIRYAAHLDSAIYGRYGALLGGALESFIELNDLHDVVLAYRSVDRKSNIEIACDAFEEIRTRKRCVAIALDVASFFESLDHNQLKEAVASLLGQSRLTSDWFNVFRSVTKYAWVERPAAREALGRDIPRRWRPNARICSPAEFRTAIRPILQKNDRGCGIPQGTPISAVMANAYLAQTDVELRDALGKLDWSYRRYSDDILLLGPADSEAEATRIVESHLESRLLAIQQAKTCRVDFDLGGDPEGKGAKSAARPPLDYLGLTFDGESVGVREASLQRFLGRAESRIRGIARGAKKAGAERLGKRKIYRQFSHLGPGPKRIGTKADLDWRGNFLTYLERVMKQTDSDRVRRLRGRLWVDLGHFIEAAAAQRDLQSKLTEADK